MNFFRCGKCYCDFVEIGDYFLEMYIKVFGSEIL